jgi:hypothetical protein
MKNIFLALIAILSFTACSSDDDNNSSEIETQLLGKWLFENPNNNPTINNSFTFTSNGNVTYSYWDGGQGNNYDSETGTFSFNGEVMTMIFPENVTLTFVQKVVFINDNVVEFEPTGVSGENAYEGDYFRDGAGSYESPDGTLKEYIVYISGYSSSSQQYPLNITYFKDDEDGQITTQIVNAQTNTDIIQSLNLESVDKIGFSYDVIGYEESIINRVEVTNVETGEIIFAFDDFEIQDNQLFMYDISENTFTVD